MRGRTIFWALPLLLLFAACDDGTTGGGAPPPPNAEANRGCASGCHGDGSSNAPPVNLNGEVETTLRGVGAHRSHLNPAPIWHSKVECQSCHSVPQAAGDPGHIDGDNMAEVKFAALALTGGAAPLWNGTTCSGAYCHGATLKGGSATTPTWTLVDGAQAKCGSCHGLPPPAPHPTAMDCGSCHPTVQPGTANYVFLDPDSHINGKVDLASPTDQKCDVCHGSGGVAAPPRDLAGNTAATAQGVGAHRAHLNPSTRHLQITCSQCHAVPAAVGAPGHIDGDNAAEVRFAPLNQGASYTRANATCAGLYCHGNGAAVTGSVVWTGQTPMQCNSCHSTDGSGRPMSGRHASHIGRNIGCVACHSTVVNAAMAIAKADLHVNGVREVVFQNGGTYNAAQGRCSNLSCHNNRAW